MLSKSSLRVPIDGCMYYRNKITILITSLSFMGSISLLYLKCLLLIPDARTFYAAFNLARLRGPAPLVNSVPHTRTCTELAVIGSSRVEEKDFIRLDVEKDGRTKDRRYKLVVNRCQE